MLSGSVTINGINDKQFRTLLTVKIEHEVLLSLILVNCSLVSMGFHNCDPDSQHNRLTKSSCTTMLFLLGTVRPG